jgi:hypothetical protein
MRLREKGSPEIVTLGWDEAQAVLHAGTHEIAEGDPVNLVGSGVESAFAAKVVSKPVENPDSVDTKRDGKR